MPLTIVSLFYSYKGFLEENPALDILIFIIAVVVGQLASYRMIAGKRIQTYIKTSTTALFTFYQLNLHRIRLKKPVGVGIKDS
ncbi:hypothetical protein KEJ21_04310 [Candidatus Bathyarchaeota archaeon]|nr:hypothetical protein [Candidatus Bathyarchaeota archaeon]MBS7630625.1 hypothetical protein [Candidatus Bathyarchaeota archaeon]